MINTAACWEIKNCPRPECPAYGDTSHRCWQLTDTLCPECTAGEFAQKMEACQSCQVFSSNRNAEIQRLAKTVDSLTLSLKETEKNLARQQQLFKTILDVSPDLVSLQDKNLIYQAINPTFRHYFDLPEEDIVGKSDAEIFPPEKAAILRTEDLDILRTGTPLSKEVLINKGNDQHWFHMVKVPVYEANTMIGRAHV